MEKLRLRQTIKHEREPRSVQMENIIVYGDEKQD